MVKRSTATVDSASKVQLASQGLVLSSYPGGSGPMGNIDCSPSRIFAVMSVSGLDPDIPDHLGHISQSRAGPFRDLRGPRLARRYCAQHSGRRSPLASWRG